MRPARLLPLLVALSAPAVAADLAQLRVDLAVAEKACAADLDACARVDDLKLQVRAAELEQVAVEQQERDAAAAKLLAEAQAAEEQQEAERRKKCAAVQLRVGAKWGPRLQECYGPFAVKAQDETGTVYEAAGGWVRVRGGKVVRWVAR